MLPNFVHIGSPKTGSGTISEILRRHPQVFTPRPKELNFFNHDERFENGLDWYKREYFSDHLLEPIVCDNSIGYAVGNVQKTIDRIAASISTQLKILITVRHPVDRAYSHFRMARYKGQFERLGFSAAVRAGLAVEGTYSDEELLRLQGGSYYQSDRDMMIFRHSVYVAPGFYADLLRRCREAFGEVNVLVLFTEDMARDLGGTMRQLTDFLDIDPIDVAPDFRANESTTLRYPWLRRLYNWVYALPPVRHAVGSLSVDQRRSLRRRLLTWNYRRNDDMPVMERDGQDLLQAHYRNEIVTLQSMTGRDLSHWLEKYPSAGSPTKF